MRDVFCVILDLESEKRLFFEAPGVDVDQYLEQGEAGADGRVEDGLASVVPARMPMEAA